MILCDKQELHKKPKDELVDELYDSLVEIDKLKRELRKYKNSNTPPSANQHLKPTTQSTGKPGKRGAPRGHRGATRPWKESGAPRSITAEECPGCHSQDIKVIGKKHQQVEESPPETKPTIIDVERDVCKCNKCNLKFLARDGRTPLHGRFGINLMVLIIFLRFIVRGVLRKTAGFLDAGFAIRLTPASVQAIITRAANAAESEYDQLKQKRSAMLELFMRMRPVFPYSGKTGGYGISLR